MSKTLSQLRQRLEDIYLRKPRWWELWKWPAYRRRLSLKQQARSATAAAWLTRTEDSMERLAELYDMTYRSPRA